MAASASPSFGQGDSSVLHLHFHERVPYMYRDDSGRVAGIVADRAARALEAAGIPFVWQETPPKRQLFILRHEEGPDCMLGWFQLPEREAFAMFSAPLHRDRPLMIVARADDPRLPETTTLDGILSLADLRLLVRDGYSYGEYVDSRILAHDPYVIRTNQDNLVMLKLLHTDRADYFLIAPEEAESVLAETPFPPEDFRIIPLADMPEGNTRHLMCSPSLGDDAMARINSHIPTIPAVEAR